MPTRQHTTPKPTHQRILDAALDLFATKGFHGTGIRDVATAAGISTANLYHYGTKEQLLAQIMTSAMERLLTAANAITERCPDTQNRLENLVRMHVVTHALSPQASKVVDDQVSALDKDSRADIIALRDRYEAFYADALAQGVAAGLYAVPDQSAARLGILEMCSGVARWFSPRGRFSALEIADIHVELVRSLLNASTPASTPTPQWLRELIEEIWSLPLISRDGKQ